MIMAPPAMCEPREMEFFPSSTQEEQKMCDLFLVNGRLRHLKTKQVLFYKGDTGTEAHFIVKGRVQVSAPSMDGKEMIFGILGPGCLVGEVSVMTGNPRTATVTALEPTTVSTLERTVLFSLLVQHPEIIFYLSRTLAVRLEHTSGLLEDIVFLNLGPRLAKRLLALAATFGRKTAIGLSIDLPLYQQDLGSMVGASRESINKQLRLWEARGIVSRQQGCLTLKDPKYLKQLFGSS